MFTIEDLIEKIYEPKSKELFRDVYASYTQGQYRATVVMLWTVIVCDLVYKLQYLRDIYDDTTAIDILNIISEQQKKNPKNPEWENTLIKEVNERTQLITDIEKENLVYLQKQRNLCAHPIITNENILFKPTKELTRSLMRTALDSVLLKTPLLAKEYIRIILEDFEQKGDSFFPWDDNFEKYLTNRYLKHLNLTQVLNLFRLLWRIVFSPHNEREKANSYINYQLLNYIFNNYKDSCLEFMKKSLDYYTYDNYDETAQNTFNSFVVDNYDIYPTLSEQTKALFESEFRPFPKNLPYFFISKFNFCDYLLNLKKQFSKRKEPISNTPNFSVQVYQLKKQAERENEMYKYIDFCTYLYTNSIDFNEADLLFYEFVRPNFKMFSIEQIKQFIKLASTNNQTYNRKRANEDHKLIVKRFIDIGGSSDDVHNTPFEDLYIELGGIPF